MELIFHSTIISLGIKSFKLKLRVIKKTTANNVMKLVSRFHSDDEIRDTLFEDDLSWRSCLGFGSAGLTCSDLIWDWN